MRLAKRAMLLMVLLGSAGSLPQAQKPEDLFAWDVKCDQRGCMLFLDVLHGAVGEKIPPDPQDSRQYISLMVAVDRATRQPAYLAFHFPPDADPKQGFFVGFVTDSNVDGKWSMSPATGGLMNLGFDSCSEDSCVARLLQGKVDDGKGGLTDFLQEFIRKDHLWLLYTRHGQPIRTMIPLDPYKAAYQRVLTKELIPQR